MHGSPFIRCSGRSAFPARPAAFFKEPPMTYQIGRRAAASVRTALAALCALSAAAMLAGCAAVGPQGAASSPEEAPEAARAEAAQALQAAERRVPGVYEGTLPCADCAGIRTALYVRAVGTYTRVSAYIGSSGAFEEAGSWHLDAENPQIVVFEPMDRGEDVWKGALEGEDKLRLLDREGRPVRGELADFYVLVKP